MVIYYESELLKPFKKHADDAGWDLKSKEDVTIMPNETVAIDTGVACEIQHGYVGIVKSRSSLGLDGINVTAGVIDSNYRGNIHAVLQNLSGGIKTFTKGTRIAQLLIVPVVLEASLKEGKPISETERGKKGFGSTGK
jgi:dUTP pyrophosphatase